VTVPSPPRVAASAALLVVLLAASLISPSSARPQPTLASKKAQAEQVLAQIQAIDAELGHAVEAFNAAEIRLEAVKAEQKINARRLEIARANFSRAQKTLEQRLVALYTSDEQSALAVLLGASSIEELINRVDTIERVSEQDARIVREVQTFRAEVRRREAELKEARVEQERVVAERAARRAAIEEQLAERRRLLSTIKDEIAEIQAAEAERQRRLQAQAEQRLSTGGSTSSNSGGGVGGNPPPGRYGGVVGIAMQYLGIPYRWGGASPSTGFDCSGFVMYVYAQVGVSLPHNAAMQYGYGSPVSRANLQPGDLVFFNGLGHNGIYIGGNQFIHSPHTGDVVKISTLTGWYDSTWYGARRL
jgi:cell wall-associated NlpC family hydrolase